MGDKLLISLLPTGFGALIDEYIQKWNDHIDWTRQNLEQIAKLENEKNNTKTPQVKKTARKQSRSTSRGTSSRPNADILSNVNGTARITRSTSRFLKEHNMIKEDGFMIRLNEEKIKFAQLEDVNEERIENQQLEKKKSINKKVSFDSVKVTNKTEESKKSSDSNNEDKQSSDKENNEVNVEMNDQVVVESTAEKSPKKSIEKSPKKKSIEKSTENDSNEVLSTSKQNKELIEDDANQVDLNSKIDEQSNEPNKSIHEMNVVQLRIKQQFN